MSLSYDHLLISAILTTKDLSTIEKLKINEDFLISPECKAAFKYLRKYYHNPTTYGHIPSIETFLQTFVGFPIREDPPDSVEVICQEIRSRYLKSELEQVADRLIYYASNNDPFTGFSFLRERGITLTSEHDVNDDLSLSGSVNKIRENYELAKSTKGMLGIPWLWPKLNKITMGMQKGHIVYVRAKTKVGKTVNMIANAVNAYKNFNARILVYSLEMNNIKINTIAAAFYANVDLLLATQGQLNPTDERRFFEALDLISSEEQQSLANDTRPKAWLTTSGEGSTGISSLKAKIVEFDPDIVIIDGVYLLYDEKSRKSDSDWKTIVNISRSLKSMQKELKIRNPIRDFCLIGIVQSDKDDEIAMAKYIKQDCDISIVLKAAHQEEGNKLVRIGTYGEVDAIREGVPGDWFMNYIPGLDCSEAMPPDPTPKQVAKSQPRGIRSPVIPSFGNFPGVPTSLGFRQ